MLSIGIKKVGPSWSLKSSIKPATVGVRPESSLRGSVELMIQTIQVGG
jgi:hypothetical protein